MVSMAPGEFSHALRWPIEMNVTLLTTGTPADGSAQRLAVIIITWANRRSGLRGRLLEYVEFPNVVAHPQHAQLSSCVGSDTLAPEILPMRLLTPYL
jgi:hypothetical protein